MSVGVDVGLGFELGVGLGSGVVVTKLGLASCPNVVGTSVVLDLLVLVLVLDLLVPFHISI